MENNNAFLRSLHGRPQFKNANRELTPMDANVLEQGQVFRGKPYKEINSPANLISFASIRPFAVENPECKSPSPIAHQVLTTETRMPIKYARAAATP